MIRDLGIIENPFIRLHPIIIQNRVGKLPVVCARKHLQRALHCGLIILRQGARISSWVRQHLVSLIKRLGQLERRRSAETESAISLPLETGQIIQ